MTDQPFPFEHDRLHEVLTAINQGTSVSMGETTGQLVLVSRKHEPKDIGWQFRQIQHLLRALYGTRLLVVGGGYGCHRIIVIIEGSPEAVARAMDALKGGDSRITVAVEKAGFDFVEDSVSHERRNFEPAKDPPASNPEAQVRKRIPLLRDQVRQLFAGDRDHARELDDFLECLRSLQAAIDAPSLV